MPGLLEASRPVRRTEPGRAVVPSLRSAEVAATAAAVAAARHVVQTGGVAVRVRPVRHGRRVAGECVDRPDDRGAHARATDDSPAGEAVADELVEAAAVAVVDGDAGVRV